MYVIAELHAAVDMKPGSYVNMPVWPYSLRISMTSGPNVPVYTGSSRTSSRSENLNIAYRDISLIQKLHLCRLSVSRPFRALALGCTSATTHFLVGPTILVTTFPHTAGL